MCAAFASDAFLVNTPCSTMITQQPDTPKIDATGILLDKGPTHPSMHVPRGRCIGHQRRLWTCPRGFGARFSCIAPACIHDRSMALLVQTAIGHHLLTVSWNSEVHASCTVPTRVPLRMNMACQQRSCGTCMACLSQPGVCWGVRAA